MIEIVEKIIDHINRDYSDPNLSIQTFADINNMSPVYLGRVFKKITAKSIAAYIIDVRMEKAKELITETNQPIKKITEKVGFTSNNYFYTVFKKYFGITPTEYRRHLKL